MSATGYKTRIRADIRDCKKQLAEAKEQLVFWRRQRWVRQSETAKESAQCMVEVSQGRVDGLRRSLQALKSL